jgi:hypothetical protein
VASFVAGLLGLITSWLDQRKKKKTQREIEEYEEQVRRNGQSATIQEEGNKRFLLSARGD